MSKQQIFTFSLHSESDCDMIAFLLRRKNRSSWIRRALRYFIDKPSHDNKLNSLYESYVKCYTLYMKELGVTEFVVPPLSSFE